MEKPNYHGLPYLIYKYLQYVTVGRPHLPHEKAAKLGLFPRSDWKTAVNLIQEVGRELCLSDDHLDVMLWSIVNPAETIPIIEDNPQRMEVNNHICYVCIYIYIYELNNRNGKHIFLGRNKSMSRSLFRIPVFLLKHPKTIHRFKRWDAFWDSNRPLTLLHHGVMPWRGRYPLDPNGSFMASGIIWEMGYPLVN